MSKYRSKAGAHGTLYLYRVTYQIDPTYDAAWSTWAYDRDHALDRWHEGAELEGYDDCRILKIERVIARQIA